MPDSDSEACTVQAVTKHCKDVSCAVRSHLALEVDQSKKEHFLYIKDVESIYAGLHAGRPCGTAMGSVCGV